MQSYPLRVRGLKQTSSHRKHGSYLSYPLRVRGLKHITLLLYKWPLNVVSFTGTWIETEILIILMKKYNCRILYGYVD